MTKKKQKREKWMKQGERQKLLLAFILLTRQWKFFLLFPVLWKFMTLFFFLLRSPFLLTFWGIIFKGIRMDGDFLHSGKSFCSNFRFKATREFFCCFLFWRNEEWIFLSLFEYSSRYFYYWVNEIFTYDVEAK